MNRFRIGVMAGCLKSPDPAATVAAAREVGAECLQVSNRICSRPADCPPDRWAATWLAATRAAKISIASAVTGFAQEDYSSIGAIHRTGGLAPDGPAEDNIANVLDAVEFAHAVGADLLTFHVGFIPETPADPLFGKLLDRLGRCADRAAHRCVRIGLESGQESAAGLKRFLTALNRPNVGVNFDPANMILYGSQDPLEAVDVLAEHIVQVHAKDATWSAKPGEAWGREVPLGSGAVNFPEFLDKLTKAGFRGALIIEREAGANPLADIRGAVELLRRLVN